MYPTGAQADLQHPQNKDRQPDIKGIWAIMQGTLDGYFEGPGLHLGTDDFSSTQSGFSCLGSVFPFGQRESAPGSSLRMAGFTCECMIMINKSTLHLINNIISSSTNADVCNDQ